MDAQQLPLVMYAIDWGDNENSIVTGVEMRDRPNPDNPHSFYHLYSYWDLKAKNAVDQTLQHKLNTVYCGNAGSNIAINNYAPVGMQTQTMSITPASDYCAVRPSVKIRDNWGWCNAGSETLGGPVVNPTGIDDCNQWAEFSGWVIVTED